MPNPKHVNDPWVRWHINLPTSVAVQVETRLLDPVTGTVAYGARAKLMEQLLREWLSKPVATLDTSQPSA